MGRDPTLQHILHFLFLAPDWTESNFRTVVKLFKRTGKNPRQIRAMYQRFWARIVTKGLVGTMLVNVAMALALGEDEELSDKFEDFQDYLNKARKKYSCKK